MARLLRYGHVCERDELSTVTVYDDHHDFYVDFVDRLSANQGFKASIDALLSELGSVEGKQVCDLACGEGHLSRLLYNRGANVVGYDLSEKLIQSAIAHSVSEIRFEVNNAEHLAGVPDAAFDVVISHLAIMDIPDLDSFTRTVSRVLRSNGRFLLTLLHPCFEAPFDATTGSPVETDNNGHFRALRVMRYNEEGFWQSDGDGVRGRVGAYHRTLSTYINALITQGPSITRVLEPFAEAEDNAGLDGQWSQRIPRFMTICCQKS